MAPDKKKIASDCWKRATEAMAKQNWDYAIKMFSEAVKLVPENVAYRQTLRGVEKKKYGGNGTGARMASAKLWGIRGRIKKARMKGDWEALDLAAEDGLTVNPWDAQLNADMGEACRERGFEEAAIFGYQSAVDSEPDNKEFNRALALLLEDRGSYTEAISCWERIYKLDPLDGQARGKITQLQAKSVMDRGGYEGAESTRDVKTGYDHYSPAKSKVPDPMDGPGVSLEADLQRAIRKEPEDVNNYLKLADLYRRESRLEEAAPMYQKALEVSGGDHNIREQLEDVELDQMRHNLTLAEEAFRTNPEDESAKKNVRALKTEFLKREVDVLSNRVQRYPADCRVKFELAKRLMLFKKWPQAIELLQRASADNRLETESLIALGKCFINDQKLELARRQFEKALPKINQHDKPALFKEAHYLTGRLCEEAGQRDAAENHYSEVLSVDYGYKDVRERLEKLQSHQDGSGSKTA